jgi:hypothetical protein
MSSFPPRLNTEESNAGHVVRSLVEPPPSRLPLVYRELRVLRRKRMERRVLTGVGLGGAVVLLSLWMRPMTSAIEAEPQVAERASETSVPEEAARPVDDAQKLALKLDEPTRAEEDSKPRRRVETKPRTLPERLEAASPNPGRGLRDATRSAENLVSPASVTSLPARSLSTCADLARSGAIDDASQCYGTVAQGKGISAELASLEQARLWGRTRGDRGRAEEFLKSYFARFPEGALRHEARLMHLHLLAEQGRHEELLQELGRILESGLVPERRAELLALRTLNLAKLGRCKEAHQSLSEIQAQAGELGKADLERLSKLCPEN